MVMVFENSTHARAPYGGKQPLADAPPGHAVELQCVPEICVCQALRTTETALQYILYHLFSAKPRSADARSLTIKLKYVRAGNAVLVKLVDQENLMAAFEDEHEAPNIDVGHVIFNGTHVVLPAGVALSC